MILAYYYTRLFVSKSFPTFPNHEQETYLHSSIFFYRETDPRDSVFAGIWMHSKSSTFEMSFCAFAVNLTLLTDILTEHMTDLLYKIAPDHESVATRFSLCIWRFLHSHPV